MFSNTGDQEAQMLAQIKALPEGDMKNSLLETFLKTVKSEQRSITVETSKREPLFIEASFDRNTKTFIKYNKEAKLQNTSVTDLAKEMLLLKKEVTKKKSKGEEADSASNKRKRLDSERLDSSSSSRGCSS
jgi:hypothetical protein